MTEGKSRELIRSEQVQLITELADLLGVKLSHLAKMAEIAPSTLNKFIKPDASHTLSGETIRKIVGSSATYARERLDVVQFDKVLSTHQALMGSHYSNLPEDVRDIEKGRLERKFGLNNPKFGDETLETVGVVAAGVWREAMATDNDVHPSLVRRLDYKLFIQFGMIVGGNSMNLIFPPGSVLHCVDAYDFSYEPSVGDYVIIERNRTGLYEFTVKQLDWSEENESWEAWPRSDDTKHQTPINLGSSDDESDEIRIKALVIGAYLPIK